MGFSLIGVLFMFCFNVELALGSDTCQGLSCGYQEIRFPFRIKGRQPRNCGYPGFDLVCTDSNETLIELHDSLNFSVNKIDYRKQTIDLSYPHNGCFPRLLHSLKLSASPFNFNMKVDHNYGDYYFFNCSALERDYMELFLIQCLSTSASSIYAVPSWSEIEDLPLSFCTKMFNVSLVPRIFVDEDAPLHLKWSEPDCGHCESKGNRCSWNSTKNEFSCLDNHKGPSTALVTTGSVLGSFFLILLTEKEEMRIHIEDEGDAKVAKQLATVGLWCIQWHAVDRPSMQTVLQMLEGDQDTLPIPPNPFASTGPSRKYAKIGVAARQIIQDLEVIQELD
ncbi:hypothetical protein Ahy_A07g034038 [Arachis hypogaea]|uniref:RING-type E3 ubiquitin transferase n=1 Tax=Arachis hypogaea TaxID=3818 RepID=A0A445CAR6_ARAHY|nr:hypothetical protein Ahy_A07g034038 [Arachis hypogaea]